MTIIRSPRASLLSIVRRYGAIPLLGVAAAPQQSDPPLYMPRAVTRAYTRGARSPDGRPGPKYWQNHARYAITITDAPPARAVTGTERITYFNDSPDTLDRLTFKLFMNIHKPGATRIGNAGAAYLTSGVHVDAFTVNGRAAPWSDVDVFTVRGVRMQPRVAPHDSVALTFDWHYDVSRAANREGMIDSTTHYLAYFYPRVAVYDDYNGWDTMEFTDQQEFYSDFNDYDVTVRVPANFLVWGTGTLENAGAVLQPEYLRRFQASQTSDETIHIATQAELRAGRVTQQGSQNSWHFTATNIPDVAFGISDHYGWDAASVVVDSPAHRRTSVQAAYNDTTPDFKYIVQMNRASLAWLSHEWPGVPYPYEKSTTFQGGAGMEYPMMVNDEAYADTAFARFVAAHEIAHTFFPFYMGINETRYGFMDEGWATTFEYLLNVHNMGADKATKFFEDFRTSGWANNPSPLEDLPIITPEDVLKDNAYGDNAYGKPALAYLALKDMLGDTTFAKCLHEFMARWHGKHPIPWDFFNTVNDVSRTNLNWFWRNWFFSNNYVDIGVSSVAKARGGYTVTVKNIGGMAVPVTAKIEFQDGSTSVVHSTPAMWKANSASASIHVAGSKALKSVDLIGGIYVDADSTNNNYRPGTRD